jgi:hypothetical protein
MPSLSPAEFNALKAANGTRASILLTERSIQTFKQEDPADEPRLTREASDVPAPTACAAGAST